MEILVQDLRYSMRSIARAPGFAVASILVIALGVGANAATFSVADFVLLRPLPYADSLETSDVDVVYDADNGAGLPAGGKCAADRIHIRPLPRRSEPQLYVPAAGQGGGQSDGDARGGIQPMSALRAE